MAKATLEETIKRLKNLQGKYVSTHRPGPTGIGKTLEDLLGVVENNVGISNTTFAEFKSARKHSNSMMTLFTKAPLPASANAKLLTRFGYVTPKSNDKKVLHTTAWATGFNSLRGKVGFIVMISPDKVSLVASDGEELGYWNEPTLRQSFERKLHHVLYVLADCIGRGAKEEFCFNEAWLLTGFSFEGFKSAVTQGVVCVDTRIGQYPDGSPHDHGTGFRVFPDDLSKCFRERTRLV